MKTVRRQAAKYWLCMIVAGFGLCLCTALITIAAAVHVPPEVSSEVKEDTYLRLSIDQSTSEEEASSSPDENAKEGTSAASQETSSLEPQEGPKGELSFESPEEPKGEMPVDPQDILSPSDKGERVWISDVPFISQNEKYPTGCESVSAVMVCRYAGLSISVDTFINSYLPRASFTYENGEKVGYHPDHYFMDDPYSQDGVGCWAPCIETAIRKFLPADYMLENSTGESLSSLCSQFIDRGIPVMVWVTMYMRETFQFRQWRLKETGELFQWTSPEHCLVLTGYDRQYYYFNDPLQGKVKYAKDVVEDRFSQLGQQSLAIYRAVSEDKEREGSLSAENSSSSEANGETRSFSNRNMPHPGFSACFSVIIRGKQALFFLDC